MPRDRTSTLPPIPAPPQLFADGTERPQMLDENVWIDVIQKMDEVYSDLLQYEVALEEKNATLEETQQFVMSVLTSMSDILVVCSRNGTIEDVNRSMVDFTGRSVESLRGTSVFDLCADEVSRQSAQRMFPGYSVETVNDCELQLRAADGSAIPVSLNCTPRYSSIGKMLGMVITGRPVGELRRAYHALRQAHDELKRTQQQLLHSEKMASLGRLVAGVAHELNNPISFIIGNVHALQRYASRLQAYLEGLHAGLDTKRLTDLRTELRIDRIIEDLAPLIEGTIEGAERTRDIVDGLKRFSAVDRDENTAFDLKDVIERSVHWVSKAASERFQVTLSLPDSMPVVGSPGQMQQVVMNLVQNAFDATSGQPKPSLDIEAHVADREIVVDFRDNGPGIEPQILPQIFDPFFTTKPVGKGTGLGLAISYGIVERHGGRLEASNQPDCGAVFRLLLPLAD